MQEQRQRERVDFTSSIEIDTEEGNKLFEDLEDLSMSGFFIKHSGPFNKDKEYYFDLTLTCGAKLVSILGKCTAIRFVSEEDVSANPSLHEGVGFKITYLEPESSEELFRVITHNRPA